ncbi:hypothetical protein [Cupriavidus basilensis]|uniref:hypothetical protein n=1 Tax=Cupriavidus basilensis TaxID=68895 RepID=UPI000750E12A|nr:hypothetical protein [Cupriavidus basilensis]
MRKYLLNLLIALDQGANTLLGGDPDETISSRAGKGQAEGKRWACVLCRFLDWFERDHCTKSIERNEGADAVVTD